VDSDDVMPLQRVTFVIDTDLTVLEVISSELVMTVHADRALSAQKAPALIVSLK
jgi:peroxiredoxin Q/BCP